MRAGGWALLGLVLLARPAGARPSVPADVQGHEDTALEQLKDPFSANALSGLDPVNQLVKYGYMKPGLGLGAKDTPSAKGANITEPLRHFQKFFGLNETGVLDNATLSLMSTPRCGAPDIMDPVDRARLRRFVLVARWRIRNIRYRVGSTSKLSKSVVERVVARAFKTWSDVSSLTFTRVTSQPIIDISFHRGEHGDREPFDGIGGVLAHAYFPQAGGDTHLDEDEPWSDESYRGVNFFQIIAHELGHSLGLAHTDVQDALMFPYYRGYQPNFRLHGDDIAGIQALYGANTNPATPAPPPEPQPTQTPRPPQPPVTQRPPTFQPPVPPYCPGRGQFDTIFSIGGSTYAIEGTLVYRLNNQGVEVGFPRPLSSVFAGTQGVRQVYAALVISEANREMLYLFEDLYVWKFSPSLQPLGRHRISEVFPGLPVPIDAVFYSTYYRAVYFFKDNFYYRSNPRIHSGYYPIDTNYPKAISIWKFGRRLDALFRWAGNNKVYFFVGNQYYRYSEVRLHVESSRVPYPRDVRTWWLGCSSNSVMAQARHETNDTADDIQVLHEPTDGNYTDNDTPKEGSPREADMAEGILWEEQGGEGAGGPPGPHISAAASHSWGLALVLPCLVWVKFSLVLS